MHNLDEPYVTNKPEAVELNGGTVELKKPAPVEFVLTLPLP